MSPQRLQLLRSIRDAAAQIAASQGTPRRIGRKDVVEAHAEGLSICIMTNGGEQLVDIWSDSKCFSFWTFNSTDSDHHLVKFKNGPWVERLLSSPALRVLH